MRRDCIPGGFRLNHQRERPFFYPYYFVGVYIHRRRRGAADKYPDWFISALRPTISDERGGGESELERN